MNKVPQGIFGPCKLPGKPDFERKFFVFSVLEYAWEEGLITNKDESMALENWLNCFEGTPFFELELTYRFLVMFQEKLSWYNIT